MNGMVWRLAVLLALAGCGGRRDDSVQAECDRQSYNDPAVHQLQIQRLTNAEYDFNLQRPFEAARKQAIYRCLAAHGAAPPGGVEPVVPTD